MTSNNWLPASLYSAKWLGWLLSLAVLLLLLVALLNYRVDPYRLYAHSYPAVETAEQNLASGAAKPYAQTQVAISKAAGLQQQTPTTLLLGNSRSEIGFDPQSAAWPEQAQPIYNGGIPGSGSKTALRMYQQAVAAEQPPTTVLVGVDFLDVLASKAPSKPSASKQSSLDRQLTIAADGQPYKLQRQLWHRVQLQTMALLSLTATRHSLMTLSQASNPAAATLRADGFNPLHEYVEHIRNKGAAGLYRSDEQKLAARLRNFVGYGYRTEPTHPSLQPLRDMLKLGRANGIKTQLYFYPYHADLLMLLDAAGFSDDMAQWKRDVVALVAEEAGPPVEDFSALSDTVQALPPKSLQPGIRPWYWEPSHFSSRIGDLMLPRLLSNATTEFGETLTLPTLDAALLRQQQALARYREQHREQWLRLKQQVYQTE